MTDKTKYDPTGGLTPEKLQELMRQKIAEKKGRPLGKALPPAFRHVIQFDWNRTFTWKERLQIVFGYSFNVLIRVPTLHKPGELGVLVMGETCKLKTASDLIQENMKQAMAEKFSNIPIDEDSKS